MSHRIVRWRYLIWFSVGFWLYVFRRLRFRGRVVNWLGNHVGWVKRVEPTSLHTIRKAIAATEADGGKIRVVSGGFSFSRLLAPHRLRGHPKAPKKGAQARLVPMRGYERILGFGSIGPYPTVTVEPGVLVGQLSDMLSRYGLVLMSPTIMRYLTIGGAISTGSHGTGRLTGTLSDSVVAITLITPQGDRVVRQGEGAFSDQLLNAASCGLGCFGVIRAVTLKLGYDRPMCMCREDVPFEEGLFRLEHGDLKTKEHLELFWFPGSSKMVVFTVDDARGERETLIPWAGVAIVDLVKTLSFFTIVPAISLLFPTLIPLYIRLTELFAVPWGRRVVRASAAFHYVAGVPMVYDAEWGIPSERAADAFRMLRQQLQPLAERGEFPVDQATHARFVGASSRFMTAAFGRETCYIEVISTLGSRMPERISLDSPPLETVFEGIDEWMRAAGGRPHWGKILIQPPKADASTYPSVAEFHEARRSVDPNDLFVNDYLASQVFQIGKGTETGR